MDLTPAPPDAHQRRIAAQIQRDHPAWLIIWGTHTRLYWAFGRFSTPSAIIIAAPGPRELTDRMRRAELTAAHTPATNSPATSGSNDHA
jgi:hypothetical protein